MEDFNTYEYAADQKIEGKYRLIRILTVCGYVLFAAVYFFSVSIIGFPHIIAVLPIFLWMLIFFTWKYTRPDYRYTIEHGDMTFMIIYGKKKKTQKAKCSFKASTAEAIAPREILEDEIKNWKPKHVYSAIPSTKSTDVYAALFKNQKGQNCVFYFIATAQALKLLRFLNPKTGVTKTIY